VAAFGDDAFGLLDQDTAVERGLKLLGEDVALPDRPGLEQADGGDVGERLAQPDGVRAKREPFRVLRAYRLVAPRLAPGRGSPRQAVAQTERADDPKPG
jgi:hypothetical protein